MKDKHIAKLETHLEQLIEGTFAHFFGRKIRAQDIALQLARTMENGLHSATSGDPRPLAPDSYQIFVSADTANHLLNRQQNLPAILSKHMIELAANAGYRLENEPIIRIDSDDTLTSGEIRVVATHISSDLNSTNILKRVNIPQERDAPENPHLIINGRSVPLDLPLLNIGRNLDNQIVIEDPRASRHHAQLRLRFGKYTLFDVKSRAGTYINDVKITEHTLQSGDVIQIGETRMVYLEDTNTDATTTQIDPVDLDNLQ